jgi:predicted permease
MVAISDEPYLKVVFDHAPPVFVRGSLVSGNYFQLLGLSPALGRLLTAADDAASVETCPAVISYRYWTNTMHHDPAVLGRSVAVREKLCIIVGVAPAGFRSHDAGHVPDLWVPLRPLSDPKLLASRSMAFFSGVIGRLRAESTIATAEAELTALYQRLQPAEQQSPRPGEAAPKPSDFRIHVLPGAQGLDMVRSHLGQPLAFAMAVVAVVLLIAAFNVANLLLARGMARSTELATRAALGAGRARLMRLLAIEGGVLSFAGGLLGTALAFAATPLLLAAIPLPATVTLDTRPDVRVLATAVGATIFAALLAGVLPAFRLSRHDLHSKISDAGRTTAARSGQRITRTLVVAQLALALLLVTSAGLLFRTILRVVEIDPGFKTSHVVLMDISDTERAARFGEVDTVERKARRAAMDRALDERLNAIPGVEAAGISWLGLFSSSYVGVNVYDVEQPQHRRFTLVDYVSPRYFEAVGMQVIRGRGFTEGDREGSVAAAVVNEAYVRERVPRGNEAIGRRVVMTYADDQRPRTIVGIVRDAKYNDLRKDTEPMIWVPLAQAPFKIHSVSLKVQPGAETAAIRNARAALTATNPYLMVRTVTTLRAQVNQSTGRERLLLTLSSSFGGIALILAAVGLYGTLAYAVARRTREIGVRMALGAQRGSVLRLVLGESLVLLFAGMLVGVPLALAAGYVLRSFLFGVAPYDVATFAGAGTVLGGVALLAAFIPARRASRVDPIVALKYE